MTAARAGNTGPLWSALDAYRDRLRRMIAFRMHRGIQGRVDASDIVQESFLEVVQRLDRFLDEDKIPFYVWVRFITLQKLQQQLRYHLGAEARDARREVRAGFGGPESTFGAFELARSLVASGLSPSKNLAEEERISRLQGVLGELGVDDLEVIALRHFEELSNSEAAHVLGIKESAASRRYLRAIVRLKELIAEDV